MKFIKRNKHYSNWYFIIKSFIKLVDALIPIVTLGFYYSNLESEYIFWRMK